MSVWQTIGRCCKLDRRSGMRGVTEHVVYGHGLLVALLLRACTNKCCFLVRVPSGCCRYEEGQGR
jgi:hypothetical protein